MLVLGLAAKRRNPPLLTLVRYAGPLGAVLVLGSQLGAVAAGLGVLVALALPLRPYLAPLLPIFPKARCDNNGTKCRPTANTAPSIQLPDVR